MMYMDGFAFGEMSDFRTEYHKALDEIARLREALKAVEWIRLTDDDGYYYLQCPWCNAITYIIIGPGKEEHAPNCPRQAALGLTDKK